MGGKSEIVHSSRSWESILTFLWCLKRYQLHGIAISIALIPGLSDNYIFKLVLGILGFIVSYLFYMMFSYFYEVIGKNIEIREVNQAEEDRHNLRKTVAAVTRGLQK